MASNDDAVLLAAKGYVFIADVDTPAPTPDVIAGFPQTQTLASPWATVGHTAREDLPVFGFDGGDTEVLGTWQNASLRTVTTEVATDYVTFNVHQFDEVGLGLYYGVEGGTTAGVFTVSEAPTGAQSRSLCIVIVDGPRAVSFHAPKVEIRREDSVELAVDEFAFLPLRATILKSGNADNLFTWTSAQINIGAGSGTTTT